MGNLHKTSARIDANGNVIDPRTKEFIRPMEEPYKIDPEDFKKMEEKRGVEASVPQPHTEVPIVESKNPLAEAIKAQVKKAVEEQIKNIDISKMVADAVKEAFK